MAMNEKLVVPYAATPVAGTSGTAVVNVLNERLGRTGVINSSVFDLGSPLPIDTVALLATDQIEGQVWNAQFYASAADAAASRSALGGTGSFPAWASPEAGKRLHRQGIGMLAAPVVARFVKIDASRPCQTGRLVIGKSFTAADTMDIGYSFKVVDLGERRRATNSLVNNTLRGKVLEFSWVWSWMSEQEARGALLDLLAYAGTTRDVLCILNPDAADLHNVIGYGSLIEEVEGVNVAGGNVDSAYEAKFRLQSRLLLNL